MTNDVVDHNKIVHSEADEPGAAFDGIRQQLAAFDPFEIHVEELGWAPRATVWVAQVVMSGQHTGTHPGCRRPPTGASLSSGATAQALDSRSDACLSTTCRGIAAARRRDVIVTNRGQEVRKRAFTKEKAGCWTHQTAFAHVRVGPNI